MSNLTSIYLETTKKSISYKLTNYFRQKWLYQTIIGDVKKHVKKAIASNLQIEEQERINSILDAAMKRVRGEEQSEIPAGENSRPTGQTKKKTKERLQQNGNGEYTVYGAALYLGIGESTLRKHIHGEKVTGFKTGNKRFFTKEELDKFKVESETTAQIDQKIEDSIMESNTGAKK